MHLLVIGASRGIGRAVVREALKRGHRVRAFARSAREMKPEPGLEPWTGDALRPADVAAALDGVDAVVHALGVPKGLGFVTRPVTLFSASTRILVQEMQVAGVRRLLAVTGFGAGNSRPALGRLLDLPFTAIMGRAYADKDRQERIIEESGLDWTIARPGFLTDSPTRGRYKVLLEPKDWRSGIVSRADVAHFLVGAAETGAYSHQAPVLIK
ncbi:NAD(P)-dependent oxidoreductase [Histidinibacterium aquaticum]|uniref:SDR family oxidoreductase n=1 Tax=Histidinibacterium aquaticum TaxID=2613962 RepID=A0A5J5GCR4_9RHOB|nr:SDR family oxidoreductase [Histidinibacterium aquaticum]KAA9005969.1 SDR family oxidoreductase [Histidinibacterium aquaticum]